MLDQRWQEGSKKDCEVAQGDPAGLILSRDERGNFWVMAYVVAETKRYHSAIISQRTNRRRELIQSPKRPIISGSGRLA